MDSDSSFDLVGLALRLGLVLVAIAITAFVVTCAVLAARRVMSGPRDRRQDRGFCQLCGQRLPREQR